MCGGDAARRSTQTLAAMLKVSFALPLLIGLVFYIYAAWLAPGAAPRSAPEMGTFAAWASAIAAGTIVFACLWGAARGLSPSKIYFDDLSPGNLDNFVNASRSLLIVAGFFCIHALVAFFFRGRASKGNGS